MKRWGLLAVLISLSGAGCTTHQETLTPAIKMPAWLQTIEKEKSGTVMASNEEKLQFVIELACQNVLQKTGGPFAAAIFDMKDNRLLAVGVNSVVPAKQSWAHAEMTAFSHAQQKLNTFCLKDCMLVTSCEPCAMCYGATHWSGVGALLYGATGKEARTIGFDEGDKPSDWEAALRKRGIKVYGPILPEESKKPFLMYKKLQGEIY